MPAPLVKVSPVFWPTDPSNPSVGEQQGQSVYDKYSARKPSNRHDKTLDGPRPFSWDIDSREGANVGIIAWHKTMNLEEGCGYAPTNPHCRIERQCRRNRGDHDKCGCPKCLTRHLSSRLEAWGRCGAIHARASDEAVVRFRRVGLRFCVCIVPCNTTERPSASTGSRPGLGPCVAAARPATTRWRARVKGPWGIRPIRPRAAEHGRPETVIDNPAHHGDHRPRCGSELGLVHFIRLLSLIVCNQLVEVHRHDIDRHWESACFDHRACCTKRSSQKHPKSA